MSVLKAKKKLGVVFFPAYDWAISATHPERQERLLYTQDQLREEGIFDIPGITEFKPDLAGTLDVDRVHFCFPDVESVATQSHFVSAGGAIRCARLIMEKEAQRAFALIRPPGHHAMKVAHGSRGFCNINIEAVMVEWIRDRYGPKRVAIVDTDCHHGDGTQDIYWHDPDTLFISLHQDGRTLYPGTGFPMESGGPKALGRTINVPLPPGTSDEGFLHVLDNLILPILADFKPDLVINSAGQDNHFSDPITDMNFSANGYAVLSERLAPDIAVLEGGYAIQGALPYVNLGLTLALAGLDYSHVREPGFDPRKYRQSQKITQYIKDITPQIADFYFDPPKKPKLGRIEGDFYVREKEIFYDTDNIQENQTESLMLCDDCKGLLRIESRSTLNPPCLGVEIPADACTRCHNLGLEMFDLAQAQANFAHVQLINRKDKDYRRFLVKGAGF